jgi:hypothetical protein
MTTTMTINDQLVELGTLVDNQDVTIQRAGADMIEQFFITHNQGDNVDDATLAQLLFYLTDIQVRDYALGLLDVNLTYKFEPALQLLLESAPTDTTYISAPACLLAVLQYEQGNTADALLTLSNAETKYSLNLLLQRVFTAGWERDGFAKMRAELHPQVTASIFGTDKTIPVPGDPEDAGMEK